MRVLISSVDVCTVAGIKLTLADEKIIYDTTDLSDDGLHLAKLYDYDIVLYDVTLSQIDGYKTLQRLRNARVDTSILILSGLGELDQKVRFLRSGADDVLTKPFDGGELLARIQAIVRRSKRHSQSTIRTGRLIVNLDTRAASVDDQPINLTNREYAILELLSLRKGATVTRESFLNQLYGGIDQPELKSMDVLICKLRKKLARATGSHYIEAVWGRGYVLRDPAPRSGNPAQNANRDDAAARHHAVVS
jgi:two-component system cell cycle response regulator CtrA